MMLIFDPAFFKIAPTPEHEVTMDSPNAWSQNQTTVKS